MVDKLRWEIVTEKCANKKGKQLVQFKLRLSYVCVIKLFNLNDLHGDGHKNLLSFSQREKRVSNEKTLTSIPVKK